METNWMASPDELSEEVAKLVFTLQETELRLQELTGGEVDAVLLPAGKSYLLSEARDRQRESEEKFQQLVDTISDVFWIRSPDMKVVHYVSPAFERVWGRSVAFLYENPTRWLDFILQADRERVQDAIVNFVSNLAGFDIEYRITRPDGEIRWVHTRGFRVLDPAGKVIRLTGMTSDITDRQKARQQLQLLETCVEHLNDLVIITEADPIDEPGPCIVFVNNAFVKRTGYTRAEALGKSPRFLQGEKTERAALDRIRFAIKRHEPVQVEIINYTKNGESFWLDLEIIPIANNQGQVTHFVAVERDITERKQAEDTLRESEERFSGAFLQAPIGVALVAPDGQFLKVNRALCQLSGYSEVELLARTFQDITHPEDLAADLEYMRQLLAGAIHTYAMEKRYVHKHRHQVTVLLNVSLVRDKQNQPLYFISQIQDITERKRLEEEFRQIQKMEGIGQLAGGVAHDFNNILAVIQLQSGLLKAEKNLNSRQLELAGDIEKAAQRAASLTNQLLLFSRKQPMQRRNLDLNQVVSSMAKMLQRILGEDIEISYKYYGGPLPIHADAGMMDQVLLNFAVNARDAMPKGGRLIIETSAAEFDEIAMIQSTQMKQGRFTCLTVADTGAGIPPEILPRIFEPFFTTKDEGKGTGLGLATVYSIAQQHQGWISVYSELGRGSTFRIYIPQQITPVDEKSFWSSTAVVRGGTETILLVEDDTLLRISVCKALVRLGYKVLEATNGSEAREVFGEQRDIIDLLLTDMVMPGGINGKELAREFLQQNPKLKVIYTSGYIAQVADAELVLDEGVNFLSKPFEVHKLGMIVRNCLDRNIP